MAIARRAASLLILPELHHSHTRPPADSFSEEIDMNDSEQIAYIISLLDRLGLVISEAAPNSPEVGLDSQS